MTRVRTFLFGLGPFGVGIGRLAAERTEVELVGGIDLAPDKAGQPLYDVLGVEAPGGASNARVESDAERSLATARPDLVLHATGSYLPDVLPQLIACARAGANVVSTCEELSFPWERHPNPAKQLDSEAKAHSVTMLGTGINPGFLMDTLAAVLSGVCQRVERVRLARIVDVSTRREQLQRKVGVGLTAEEFQERVATGRFGHVGLKESCWLLAEALGWQLDTLEETIKQIEGADGRGAGIRQLATGTLGDRTVIEALVQMSTDVDRARDEIEIDGTPPVRMTIDGGVPGDHATAAIIVNAARRVVDHAPGLITMLDLPVVTSVGARP
ncbi:MAG: dihydrodipicolinate reductase [Dehalococcoidia bacterium]